MDTRNTAQVARGYVEALPLVSGKEKSAKVVIVTDAGETYAVVPKGPGTELVMHVSAPVEVTGAVARDGDLLLIQVYSCQVQDGYDDAWYERE